MEQPSFLHKSGRAIMKTATSTKPGTRCLCLGAPRDRACARRERWDRWSFRAGARRGFRCRRSYARCGPVPLRLTYLVGYGVGPKYVAYAGPTPLVWDDLAGPGPTPPMGDPAGRFRRRATVSTSCVAGEGLSVSVGGGCEGSVQWGHVLPRVVCAGGAVDGPGSHRAVVGCYARGGAT
ncbi:MAG: hypothetical protein RIS56_1920 [Verrucomicrobiota bacterium]